MELIMPAGTPACIRSLPRETDVPSAAQDPARARAAQRGPQRPHSFRGLPSSSPRSRQPGSTPQGQAAVLKRCRPPHPGQPPSLSARRWNSGPWLSGPPGGCYVALEPWPALSEPLVPPLYWTLVSIADKAQGLPRSPSIQPGKVDVWGGSLSSCSTAPLLPAPRPPGPLLFSSLGHLSASAWVGVPPRPALGRAGSSHWRPLPCPAFPLQEQNGDSHHAGDWRGPGRDLLPLPVRSRKYQEGPDAAERRPREGGHSPLDSADVRVQLPRTVGAPPRALMEPLGGSTAHPARPPGGWAGVSPGAEAVALC